MQKDIFNIKIFYLYFFKLNYYIFSLSLFSILNTVLNTCIFYYISRDHTFFIYVYITILGTRRRITFKIDSKDINSN